MLRFKSPSLDNVNDCDAEHRFVVGEIRPHILTVNLWKVRWGLR